ncbi:MAG: glycosyltransferase [Pseudanabaenaceae cyanobacterium bins.39]|nr:glycosyltransferase [Pseudanabaenaceae cyanobacterium bins.39]
MPKVTVLMPVYNGEKYLREAIDSILNQTFQDFEFLIMNDGSSDRSLEIIRSYNDNRIKLFDSDQNKGHVYHLNYGIDIASGKYIVRMDADDISLPSRIEKQVTFMDNNPDIGVCGTWYEIIDSNVCCKNPVDDVSIRLSLLTNSALGHPTVILRSKVLSDFNLHYDPLLVPAEDYWFWVNLSRYSKLANLPEILLQYRVHSNQISSSRKSDQQQKAQLIRNLQIEMLLERSITIDEQDYHSLLFQERGIYDINKFVNVRLWVDTLINKNFLSRKYPHSDFSNILTSNLKRLYRNSYFIEISKQKRYNFKILTHFFFSHSQPFIYFSNNERLKFIIKCLIGYRIYIAGNLE